MKKGQIVFVIHRSQNVIEGVLGGESTAQGFYTRWGPGYMIYFKSRTTVTLHSYNNEDIFCTKEEANKELFMRRLRYPRIRNVA